MRTWWASLSTLLLLATPAFGQSFPAANAWVPFRCGGGPMTDPVRDQMGATQERDLVGGPDDPAAFRAVDERFLYLRLRVEDVPTQGAQLRPSAWGFAFSTDGKPTDYEVLISVDGTAGVVALYRNTVATVVNSPTDPADAPPVATYPFATHGRVSVADVTNYGGNPDHFIDMAVPWTALMPLGLPADRPIVVWAASSTSADRLNGDFACHDGRGSAGVPDLDRSASDSTTASATTPPPAGGAGGGAGGAGGAGGLSLEGGPGCAFVIPGHRPPGPPAGLAPLIVLLALWIVGRRRRR
jgi:hypothetical protein